MDTEITQTKQMLAEVSEKLRSKLHELQKTEYYNSYCIREPEKWMAAAKHAFEDRGTLSAMRTLGISQQTYYKVRKQIFDIKEEYKTFQINNLDANMDAIDDITAHELQAVSKEGLDLEKAKAIKELNVAGQIIAQRRNRLSDGADKVMRVEQAKTKEQLAQELEEMFKESTIEIDAEVINGEELVCEEGRVVEAPSAFQQEKDGEEGAPEGEEA